MTDSNLPPSSVNRLPSLPSGPTARQGCGLGGVEPPPVQSPIVDDVSPAGSARVGRARFARQLQGSTSLTARLGLEEARAFAKRSWISQVGAVCGAGPRHFV